MTTATRTALDELRAQFSNTNGYLAACTAGLVTAGTRDAMTAEYARRPDIAEYCRAVEASRGHFAALVGVSPHGAVHTFVHTQSA